MAGDLIRLAAAKRKRGPRERTTRVRRLVDNADAVARLDEYASKLQQVEADAQSLLQDIEAVLALTSEMKLLCKRIAHRIQRPAKPSW